MSVSYIIDKKRKLVVTTARGSVTYLEVIDLLGRLKKDPSFSPRYGHLVDHTEVNEFTRTVQEIELLAKWRVFSASSQWAFVAPNKEASELAREFDSHLNLLGAPKALAFHDKEEALRWFPCVEQESEGD
jgi:hypothetical protein